MTILQMATDFAGQVGYVPRRVKIQSTDSYATVTAAGYINGAINGVTIAPTDIIDMIYNFNTSTGIGSYAELLPSFSNGILTLSAGNGTTTLPTIANHLAVFSDTVGGLTEDVATAINGGNIQAGLSGAAGTLASFPGTAASGKLVVAAVNNSGGNFNTTISNAASVGQSQVLSVPDGGAAASNFIISNSAGTQHITTGSLSVDVGNVAAGSSGHAGTISSFPATASKGSLVLAAVNNTGNTVTTISNAAMAQASVISIPDPANATADFVIAPAALVNGNLVSANGTAGLVQDSGISAALVGTFTVSVSLNQAAVQGAYDTPVQLIAAPGANKAIMVLNAAVYTNFQTSAFANGGVAIVQYDSTVHGAGTNALAATIPAAEITAAASQIYALNESTATALTGITNKGIFFSNQTGAFTGGSASSTVVVTLTYQIITATV